MTTRDDLIIEAAEFSNDEDRSYGYYWMDIASAFGLNEAEVALASEWASQMRLNNGCIIFDPREEFPNWPAEG